MTTGSPTPLDPFSNLLLAGAQKVLELLIESGYDKAKEALRRLTGAEQKELKAAFERAWKQASAGKYDVSLKPLLAHEPFQKDVIVALLDPIDGFNIESIRDVWQEQLPQHERGLKTFFRNLEAILLRDKHWQLLLEAARQHSEPDVQDQLAQAKKEIVVRQVVEQLNLTVGHSVNFTVSRARIFIYQNYYLAPSGERKLNEQEFDACLKDYLEWVELANDEARLYGEESMAASKGKPLKHLGDIFMPLTLRRFSPLSRDEVEKIEAQRDLTEKKRAYLMVWKDRQKQGDEIALQNILQTGNRLAVIGGPGCGKSTLLAYLSLCLARQIHTGKLPFKLPEGRKWLVPVMAPLRYYRQYRNDCAGLPQSSLQQPCAGTLRGFIPWYINRYSNRNFPEDFFDRLLRGGGCLLMLDGLDEVVNQRERAQVRADVERLIQAQYPNNLIIVTAREAGYKKDAVFSNDFTRLEVQPLDDDQIAGLCQNWCRQLFPAEADNKKDELVAAIKEINQRAEQRQQEALVRSPLLTSMVISVKYHDTELPRERARLYEAVVRVILQAQYLYADNVREELALPLGDWREQLERLSVLALEMHQGGEAGAVISEARLKEILGKTMDGARVEQVVQYVRMRGGLFEERAEMFQFIHLSFQEFLAASRLAKLRKEAYPFLIDHITDPWWREVFMLVYGAAKMDFSEAAQNYLKWLQTLDGNDEQALGGLELAGAALLDVEKPQPDLMGEVARKLVSLTFDPEKRTTPPARARAGNTLARLGDPRFDDERWFLPRSNAQAIGKNNPDVFGFVLIPAGPFVMGSRRGDEDAYDDEYDQHEVNLPDYYLARTPVTVAQFRAFMTEARPKLVDKPDLDAPANHPVVSVSWNDALQYCRWLSAKLREMGAQRLDERSELAEMEKLFWRRIVQEKWRVMLPSEAEWEKAARGPQAAMIYPWRDVFDPDCANVDQTGLGTTSAVGCFPKGRSPYGLLDLSGNVWEWTRSQKKPYPYDPADGRENLKRKKDDIRVLRGGSFINIFGVRPLRLRRQLSVHLVLLRFSG